MHRALASYTTPTDDDAAGVLKRHGSIVERSARRLALRAGNASLYDDLWSAGALGLVEAARRFEANRGASFETFVEHRVRGAMLDELRRIDHLPRRLRTQTADLADRRDQLTAVLGRQPTGEEIASDSGLSIEEIAEMDTLAEPHLSLEWVAQSASAGSAEDDVASGEIRRALTAAIADLPERRQVVRGRME